MKKLISLLCTLTIVMGLSATTFHSPAPQVKGSEKVAKALKTAKTEQERQAIIRQFKTYQRSHSAAPVQHIRKAPKAKYETTNLTITRVSSMIYTGDGTIFYGLHTDDFAPAFYFDIPLAEGARDVELGRTYTLQDMNAASCEWDDEDWNQHYYTAATFVKTKGEHYDVHIAATVTDDDGNNWNLQYDEIPLIPTGETINVKIERPMDAQEYITQDGTWMLRASDNKYGVQLMYYSDNSESPEGTFDKDHISWNETLLNIVTDELDEYDDPVVKTVYAKDGSIAVTKNEAGRVEVLASLLFEDGKVYVISLYYELPKKESEATITASNMNVDDWGLSIWGELGLFAEDENGVSLGLSLYPDDPENILVSYEFDPQSRHSGYIAYNSSQFAIYTGTVTLSYDGENAQYVLTGRVLAWDNVEYTLNLRSPLAVVTEADFETEDLILDIYPDMNAWQAAGFDQAHERFLSIGVYSKEVAGTYNEANLEPQVTYLANSETAYMLSTADLDVTYADGIAAISGTLLLINQLDEFDHLKLTVNVKAHPYVPGKYEETIGVYVSGYNESEGRADIYYSLLTTDSTKIFQFDFPVDRWAADIESDKVYTLEDMVPNYSIIVNYDENTELEFVSAMFSKSLLPNDSIAITAAATDARGNEWTISYQGPRAEFSARSYISLGQANLFTYGDGSGFAYEMVDVDNSFKCVLSFNLPGQTDVEDGVFYTSESFNLDLGCYVSLGHDDEIKLVSATFQRETGGGETEISATVTDERGFVYVLSYYDDGFQPTGDTLHYTINQPLEVTYWDEYKLWMLRAENDTLIFGFELNGDADLNIVGDQTDVVSVGSSHIEVLVDAAESNWQWIQFISIRSLVISGEKDQYKLDATVTGEDGNVYVLRVETDAQGVDTVSVEAPAAKKVMCDGHVIILRGGKAYTITGQAILFK